MGGVNVDSGGKGGRRQTDSEINLIPMIDLFIVCISFLLITAVWSQMARINANAQVPGPPRPEEERENVEPEKMLTVEMKQDEKFVLIWKSGATVHATSEVNRKAVPVTDRSGAQVRYPDLAKEIAKQWKEYGSHQNDNDAKQDQAILSVDNRTPFGEIIAVIDAVYQPKRTFKGQEINALNVTFSSR
jgi:biopolymer transport protein ExbD